MEMQELEHEHMTQKQIEETFNNTDTICEQCGKYLYHDVIKDTFVCLECGFEENIL